MVRLISLLLAVGFILTSCTTKEVITVPDNDAPHYDEVPTSKVINYINRAYIDLIGREPLDGEMDADLTWLRANELSTGSRDSLLRKLQYNSAYLEGDSSLSHAYHQRLYELIKARTLESASDADLRTRRNIARNAAVVDSLSGDIAGYTKNMARVMRLENVLNIPSDSRKGIASINESFARTLNNDVYDVINMNAFNFINAAFDDLFFRFPTQFEFDNAFDMIEYNQTGTLFQQSGQNKFDFIRIMTESGEFYEGMVRWAYLTLLAREPSSLESSELLENFAATSNLQKVQRAIMVTDEYANFD